jgi:DNA-binding beta-propeller fold protein YncE
MKKGGLIFRATMALGAILLRGGVVARADVIYVSNRGEQPILKFSSKGGAGTPFVNLGAGNFPYDDGATLDGAGNFYLATEQDIVFQFTPAGEMSIYYRLGQPGPTRILNQPRGIAFDRSGDLYEADYGSNSINWITAAGRGFSLNYDGMNGPTGLAFDTSGDLFVSNWGDGTIVKVVSRFERSVFASGLNDPTGMAFDSAGNLFVADYGDGEIKEFTPDGIESEFAALKHPWGLAFDSSGFLYATSFESRVVERYTADGVGTVFERTTFSPTYLAIGPEAAVPEPGSVGIIGCCVVGAVMRRRRR